MGRGIPDRPAVRHDDGGWVTFVSLMVHIYTIGYMDEDSGLPALLQLHFAVHVLDADAGDVEQFRAIVLRLGSRGAWCRTS